MRADDAANREVGNRHIHVGERCSRPGPNHEPLTVMSVSLIATSWRRTLKRRDWLELPAPGADIVVHDVHREADQ